MTVTRTAIFEGRIKPGFEDVFFKQVRAKLVPLWRAFPGALDVRLLEIDQRDADAAPIVMIQQIDYADLAAIDAALASPQRTAARAATMEIMKMFEGRFYHLVSQSNVLAA
jgi:quinol monooxygenase YgiN